MIVNYRKVTRNDHSSIIGEWSPVRRGGLAAEFEDSECRRDKLLFFERGDHPFDEVDLTVRRKLKRTQEGWLA